MLDMRENPCQTPCVAGVPKEELRPLVEEILRDMGILAEEKVPAREPEDLRVLVSGVLRDMGMSTAILGYQYCRAAICMAVEDPSILEQLVKGLYPEVARKFGSTGSRVERAIRHAIEMVFDRGDPEYLQKYFGWTVSQRRGKPTNGEFISQIADQIRLSRGLV